MSLVAAPRETFSSIPAAGAATMPERVQLAHIESLPDSKRSPACCSSSSATDSNSNTNSSSSSTYSSDSDSEDDMISPRPCLGAAAMADAPPALPAKSALRASRILGAMPHKLPTTEQPPFPQTAPHDVYLSSEEDASSSADDFSDFDLDSDSETTTKSSSSPRRRGSHEDIARVVSVIFSGKPSIINLPPRSSSPSSVDALRPVRRLQRTVTEPSFSRRMSVSSSASSAILPPLHPPRTSSMLPGRRLEKQRPQFLQIDPFASARPDVLERRETESPRPKTPTAMFKRTLSLVRKRSKPHLSQPPPPRDILSIQTQFMEQVAEEPTSAHSTASATTPMSYNELLKSRRRTQTPISPMSDPATPLTPGTPNSTRSRLRQGFSAAARRRSSIIRA